MPAPSRFVVAWAALGAVAGAAPSTPTTAAANFHQKVQPILAKYCYDCHGGGLNKGQVTLDEFKSDADILAKRDVWLAALKNVRAGLMPPREEGLDRPTDAEIGTLANWIKYEAFAIDPQNPDPGRVTTRRLNRVEYRNTIRDLMGFDFNSEVEFPPDDSGNGFDNNGDVLTISPLLLEKYLAAAETIVERAVPKVPRMMTERTVSGRDFRGEGATGENLNARRAAKISRTFNVDQADKYQVVIELEARGSFDFDASRCDVIARVDGREVFKENVVWAERRILKHEFEFDWMPGSHTVAFEIVPLPPLEKKGGEAVAAAETSPRRERTPPATNVSVRVASVQVRGPLSPKFWTVPENYTRFFSKPEAPAEAAARDAYAGEILKKFATRAFRRPVEDARVGQLVGLARQVYQQSGKTFEEGIGRAMMAVLGSPRFLFRVESTAPATAGGTIAPIDEHALASRLSYFLWSTMPDDELFDLAGRGQLRAELKPQLDRMLKDAKAQAFIRNFTGQWLQARDIESVPINVRSIFGFNAPASLRTREGRTELDGNTRRMMRSETEKYFEHILREDRNLLELVDSDYTFLNEKLAAIYEVPDVTGDELRLVKLPPNSPRGGVITQGAILTVTSNPTRTSPVKRGLFILENILGTPPPPPPPDVPDIEESKKEFKDREPKLSEMLAVHRANKMCSSCHQRMDPLGLALENFNAVGIWRDTEARQPIEPSGELITGEKFADVRQLKRVLATERKLDVYRCMTEKLFTYALGRGLDYHDTHTVDEIVTRLAANDGRMSVLMQGVIESPAFQRARVAPRAAAASAGDQ